MDPKPVFKPDPPHEGLDGTYLLTELYPGFSDLLDMASSFDPVKLGVKVSGPGQVKGHELDTPWLGDLSAYQHRYWSVDFRPGQDSGDPDQPVSYQQADLSAAHTWSSELVDADGEKTGYHTVMLDVDHPVRVVPSSTPGHYHLYIEVPVEHEQYFDALDALVDANILERGYVEASRARGGTHVRLPWVKKADPVVDFFQSDEQAAELEAAVKANPSLRPDVLLAIPEDLAIGIEQSKAGDVAPYDWRSTPDAQEPYDEHAEKHPTGGGAASRSREEIVEELKIRESVTPLLRFLDSPEGQTVEWDVTQYEVKYVNGRGVLRRKAAKTESAHPEA